MNWQSAMAATSSAARAPSARAAAAAAAAPRRAGRSNAPRARSRRLARARAVAEGRQESFNDESSARRAPTPPPPPPDSADYNGVTLTRGQLVRKDVVTRTSGVRLGVTSDLWVDTDAWEVVALDVRPSGGALLAGVIGGAVDHVLMSSLRQVGDVVLVHDESAVERRWSSYGLSTVVGCDVVTERGTYIGRVRDYEFDPDDGLVQRVVVDALGLPLVPEGVVSTYALDVSEILSAGMDRVIVAEGAEARVEQLSVSLLQRLQLTAPPWEGAFCHHTGPHTTALAW